MTQHFQFGLVVRGQAEEGEDISRRFQETMYGFSPSSPGLAAWASG